MKPSEFTKIEFDDGEVLSEENLHASLVGMAVDYLTRAMLGTPLEEAFKISILGAQIASEEKKIYKLLKSVKGLDDKSIATACKIVGYDVCYRSGPFGFKGVDHIKADENTIKNIRIMVVRSLTFFEEYGPITKDGFTFEGGYTNIITAGDGDFLTADTLWDFKVSKNNPTSAQTLQLLIYYIMGKHSIHSEFEGIENLGIFNPRQNCVYLKEIQTIPDEIIAEVSQDIIGYRKIQSKNYEIAQDEDLLSITDIMNLLSCSRHMVMKYYSEQGLPLFKVGRRYMVNREDLVAWVEIVKTRQQRQKAVSFIIGVIVAVLGVLFLLYMYNHIPFNI